MSNVILGMNIVDGPAILGLFAVAGFAALYLIARRPTRRWMTILASATVSGLVMAVLIWFFTVRVWNLFGVSLGTTTYAWLAASCVGVSLAVASLWRSSATRTVIASASVVLFLITGALGINAGYGLNRTLGSLFGVSAEQPIQLAQPKGTPGLTPTTAGPLWKSWTPPPDMPAQGTTGTQMIPPTLSGFVSRPAGLYLPPAALVADPPKLPFVLLLMGQPGNPDPSFIAATLDHEAALHHGLAPIVLVADQLGDPAADPLCLDTPEYGNAESFITGDVVNWARANLNILSDPQHWTIAGYSNGGQCAISLAAKHPTLWSNVIDISGEEFAGSEIAAATLHDVFHGDQAAYDAQKPVTLLAAHPLPGTFGVFTVGSNDAAFIPGARRIFAAAQAAGMTATYWESPNGGHVLPALTDGLNKAFEVLYPHLGLAPPQG
ncbi:hypothetical protein JF66_07655 [Cryobacterium sp. MLB-32]|uniref:alpha/beta hydrolase n=1 Tax=Cryobacterium sp. MLB-32 TaxID=1529318 RepID=UPI0004E6FCEA|nr:alpha/beta hydrolase-fold protein [Cryobacterium sp. MLB-32]KFF59979.1 hypothetical protein JF66_07655 [Cryobacterium sp. MLB-32]